MLLSREVQRQGSHVPSRLHLSGKLSKGTVPRINGCANTPTSHLLRLYDPLSNASYLIDTGAEISIVPLKHKNSSALPSLRNLFAANGTHIPIYGEQIIELSFNLRRLFSHSFIIGDVTQPIIGADFLNKFDLIVDIRQKCLIDRATRLTTYGTLFSFPHLTISAVNVADPSPSPFLTPLLSKFPNIFKATAVPSLAASNVKHYIETTGPPVFACARRLPPDKLSAAKAEIAYLMENGILRPSNSPYASPIHLVPKGPAGSATWRLCGDYRALNSTTIPDRYPLPHLQDFTANLSGATIFSKIDLVKAFHQLDMAEVDIPKTAIITSFGLFEYLKLPYGLKNAAQSFQRYIDAILRGLTFAFPYLDDILIASSSEEQHHLHLQEVCQRLNEYGIRVNPEKCEFGKETLTFLGHLVSKEGILPVADKVSAINDFPLPANQTQLRQFLGMFNFYHRFIPNAASLLAPVTALLKPKRAGTPSKLDWPQQAVSAFEAAKAALANATSLAHPSSTAATRLQVDASDFAAGAVLQQCHNGMWYPLAFFSKKFTEAEQKYSAFSRELLAIYLAVRKFRYFVEGRVFSIYTDHLPLTFAMKSKLDRHNPREARHLEYISQFTTDIRHISGSENVTADALSRIEVNTLELPSLDLKQLAIAQLSENIKPQSNSSLTIEWIRFPDLGCSIHCDTSTGTPRPLVPPSMRKQVFQSIHNLNHPGIAASQHAIRSRFAWDGMLKDIKDYVTHCIPCQRSKVHRHTKAPLGSFMPPGARFERVHVDIVGPLPPSEGYTYLLTMIDRFTRWTEAAPLREITAEAVAKAFLSHWVARFGVPASVTTDQGRQFESATWHGLMSLLGTERYRSSAYHPICQGIIERFHRQLKASIIAHPLRDKWMEALPLVMLGIRTSLKEDLQCSAAELVYGTTLLLPGEFFTPSPTESFPNPASYLTRLRMCANTWKPTSPRPATIHSYVPKDLQTCTHVFVRHDSHRQPLQPKYDGPFAVTKRTPKLFTIQKGTKTELISIDRLKPAFIEITPELPPPPITVTIYPKGPTNSTPLQQPSMPTPPAPAVALSPAPPLLPREGPPAPAVALPSAPPLHPLEEFPPLEDPFPFPPHEEEPLPLPLQSDTPLEAPSEAPLPTTNAHHCSNTTAQTSTTAELRAFRMSNSITANPTLCPPAPSPNPTTAAPPIFRSLRSHQQPPRPKRVPFSRYGRPSHRPARFPDPL